MSTSTTGGPSDRWITFNATRKTRFWFVATGLTTGIIAASLLGTAFVMRWLPGMIGGAIGLVPTIVTGVIHFINRTQAIGREKAFLASLPYPVPEYLEAMRQPRVRSSLGTHIEFFPRVTVIFASTPDEPALRAMCEGLPHRGSLAIAPDEAGRNRVLITSAEGTMRDPWPWLRTVLSGLGPIVTKTPPIEINIDRGPTSVADPDASALT